MSAVVISGACYASGRVCSHAGVYDIMMPGPKRICALGRIKRDTQEKGMSRKKLAGKAKKAPEQTPASKRIMKDLVALYVFFMFAIYPLYYENKYYNMGDAKWHFFKWVTLIAMIAMACVFIWYQLHLLSVGKIKEYWDLSATSIVDRFVLAYAFLAVISFLLSPYKVDTLFGYDGWYMGLVSQLAFVAIYYFVSRFWRWDELLVTGYLAVSSVVFLLCLLNRFGIDPMEMYVDLEEQYYLQFVSTLGQTTWFSSYMVLLFPIGLFVFWYSKSMVKTVAAGVYVFLGAMTMIEQNSDSAFLAYGFIYLVLFMASFKENIRMRRFLESLVLLFAGWKTIGILQVVFSDRVVMVESFMTTLSVGPISWVLLGLSAALLILYIRAMGNEHFSIETLGKVRYVVAVITVVIIAAIVVYVVLNTKGVFAGTPFASDNNYLFFDDRWGNSRGSSWKITVATFLRTEPIRKLFGVGPDGFHNEVYRFFNDELVAQWGQDKVLTCAHNEWMNAIINMGVIGGIAYIGVFISGMIRYSKKSIETPETLAVVMCIAGYMAHNFFCYQQIICTPAIFIIMGAGEMMSRYGKREIWEQEGDL